MGSFQACLYGQDWVSVCVVPFRVNVGWDSMSARRCGGGSLCADLLGSLVASAQSASPAHSSAGPCS